MVDLARKEIETGGVSALSFRALAKKVGITHRAIHNHFADKDTLLSAITVIGFRELAALLSKAKTAEDYVRTYATFALKYRDLYNVLTKQKYHQFKTVPEIRSSVDQVLLISLNFLASRIAEIDAKRRAVARVWMLVHGGVGLHLAGALHPRSDDDFIEELLAIIGISEGQSGPVQTMWNEAEQAHE